MCPCLSTNHYGTPIMKISLLALALVAATPAFAGNSASLHQPLTRAEVHAQAVEAVRLGQTAQGERDFVPVATKSNASALTRAEVRAQAVQAVRLGQIQSGERDGVAPLGAASGTASGKTRDEVKAELAAYMKTPEYAARNAEASH